MSDANCIVLRLSHTYVEMLENKVVIELTVLLESNTLKSIAVPDSVAPDASFVMLNSE